MQKGSLLPSLGVQVSVALLEEAENEEELPCVVGMGGNDFGGLRLSDS